MNYRVPKELEKVPVVFGLPLKTVVFVVISALLFVFLMVVNFLFALIFPILVGSYIYINKRFKKNGEFLNFIKYSSASKVINFDKTIEQLLNNK